MKIVIQRVKEAKVLVENKKVSEIEEGYVLLVGIENGDTQDDLKKAAEKISRLRIFEDIEGKMNLDIHDVQGSILAVSQFTLAGDMRKGNRPSFVEAMSADKARDMFEVFVDYLKSHDLKVESGIFQTHMNVMLDNDGPVTLIMHIKDGKLL